MRYPRLLFCCLLLPLLLAACTKRASQPGKAAAAGNSSGAISHAPAQSGTIRLEPVQRGGGVQREPSPKPTPAAAASNLSGTDRLLTLRGGRQVLPSDFAIGALAPDGPAGTEEGQIVTVIHEFFSALSSGSVDAKVILPQWRDDLQRRLSFPIAQHTLPSSVRIGQVGLDGGTAHAAIRLAKGKAWAAGEIYLERRGDRWYISDLQVDFTQLDRPTERTQPFDPAEWKALMKE